MNKLQAIIFDVDGTLAETERDGHRVAFNHAFIEAGLDWHWSEDLYSQLLVVAGAEEKLSLFLTYYHDMSDIEGDVGALIHNLSVRQTKHYAELLNSDTILLRPGVERLINEIRASGLRLAIATTTTAENVAALIKHTLGDEALSWFDCIAAGDIVQAKKPAPDIYQYCLKKMNLAPEECLAFEDSEDGVLSSCAAEIPTIVTVNSYTKNDRFSEAITVLDHLGEPDLACSVIAGQEILGSFITVDDLNTFHDNNT